MKSIIITAALILGISTVFGQSKPPKHLDTLLTRYFFDATPSESITSLNNTGSFLTSSASIPPASIIINGNTSRDVIINLKKDGKEIGSGPDWDIITFKMKKAQFYWINDSTAVFVRKPIAK